MSDDELGSTSRPEDDPFDTIGREIATLLRTTHETSSRIQEEAADHAARQLRAADEEAARRLATADDEARDRLSRADERAAEVLAEADRKREAAIQQLEEAEALVDRARVFRERTVRNAEAVAHSVLTLVDAADARSAHLADEVGEWRAALNELRSGLVDLSKRPEEAEGDPEGRPVPEPDEEPIVLNLLGPDVDVIDLRDRVEPPVPPADGIVGEDRLAESVRSAVSRAIDQCLTTPAERFSPPHATH